MTHGLRDVFDLTSRLQPGQTSRYRLVIVQHHLDELQNVIHRLHTSGDFQREVVDLKNGVAIERITWQDYFFAIGQGRVGPLAEPQRLPWTKDFSYLFCAEDGYEDFHWNYQAAPETREGDAFMLHCVNAHFEFDFLRSSKHGGIQHLHRIGDQVVAPDSGHSFQIGLRATPVSWVCTKQDLNMAFQGISEFDDRPVAVLEFSTWLDVQTRIGSEQAQPRSGNTQFDGHLFLDPRDGSLAKGDFNEWVTLPLPGPTGKEPAKIFVTYRIERLSTGSANN